jgi:cobyric acid synthase CobQ/L-threonine-O-3-phosphate decarboxylase
VTIDASEMPTLTGTGHGGNVHAFRRLHGGNGVLDFSANINPIGPPEWLRGVISRSIEDLQHYPDPLCHELVTAISGYGGYSRDAIVVANGSTELLYVLMRIMPSRRVVIPIPAYIDYSRAAQLAGKPVETLPMGVHGDFRLDPARLAAVLRPGDLAVIGSPNNPTGALVPASTIFELARDFPQTHFVVDEAFLDFVPEGESAGGRLDNVSTLNSLTKFYAIPGLRLGFGVFPAAVAVKVREHLPPWTVNTLAQAIGTRALQDREYQQQTRAACSALRDGLADGLRQLSGIQVFPGSANYLFLQLSGRFDAVRLAGLLAARGILIRRCDNYDGLDRSFARVAVRTAEENARLLTELGEILEGRPATVRKRNKTPCLMFQGTSSNAGKSVLTAALCRILLQDGVRVAPFKAQNMSLNSFVTLHGEEMGRAQVVQAQAARLDPDVRMNPVLLKPSSDTGSQVIVRGRPVRNMSVGQYHGYKEEAWAAASACYDSLADEYQAIVLEGAGSPGEVNLKRHDFVNMRMARHAGSPVLLVGDIDRGGVYASFVGTMEVLAEWERRLVAGFVVNRFRGQASLLASAHDYVRDHTGREVFGVVPYFHDLDLPEEDSVSFKGGIYRRPQPDQPHIDIAVVSLPHISNFTDVEPFLAEPDVHLRVVAKVDDLGSPDALILPGSKNVIGDLRFLRESGFAGAITRLAGLGCTIAGVCGGYQLLGRRIDDPLGLEAAPGTTVDGLGLLEIVTELKGDKTLLRRTGVHLPTGLPVSGYEIHHGVSSHSLPPVLRFEDGSVCGATGEGGGIWGCYLHGIFDEDEFRRRFIDDLLAAKGLPAKKIVLAPYDLEAAFDRLAARVRDSLAMDRIYALMGL